MRRAYRWFKTIPVSGNFWRVSAVLVVAFTISAYFEYHFNWLFFGSDLFFVGWNAHGVIFGRAYRDMKKAVESDPFKDYPIEVVAMAAKVMDDIILAAKLREN